MEVDAYINSGILDSYCLGYCTEEEQAIIEKNAADFPAIQEEIGKIRNSIEEYFLSNVIKPAPSVKISLMQRIYKEVAITDMSYPPLINEKETIHALANWCADKIIVEPDEVFENLFVQELPSTEEVTNFFVFAKKGHETEIHHDYVEYLYLVKGSCTMNFDGVEQAYKAGELISIPRNVHHFATVTSDAAMIALVQRQACA